jgi:hypothetical protein
MVKVTSLLFVYSLLLLAMPLAMLAESSIDFDGDSIADPVYVSIRPDGRLVWRTSLSITGNNQLLGRIGQSGNNVIFGAWSAPGSADIGTVTTSSDVTTSSNNQIEWTILGQPNRSIRLGNVGGYVMSGGDLNANGILDSIVVNKVRRRALWRIQLDPFALYGTTTPTIPFTREVYFGQWRDIHFLMPQQSGISSLLGIITQDANKKTVIKTYDLYTQRIRTIRRIPRIFSSRNVSTPEPIRGADGQVRLLLKRDLKDAVQVIIYSLKGRRYTKTTLPKNGDIILGDFGPEAGEEVAVQNSNNLWIYNPSTGSITSRPFSSAILVDRNNRNFIGNGISPAPTPDPGVSKPTPLPVDNINNITNCSNIIPFPNSHIYKTIGSTHFSANDIRRNTIGLIIKPGGKGPFPSCINVVDTDGNLLASMGLYARGNGWEARYYAGIGCGTKTPYNGRTVGDLARQGTGSSQILFNFEGLCYGPIDATQCIGSSQC